MEEGINAAANCTRWFSIQLIPTVGVIAMEQVVVAAAAAAAATVTDGRPVNEVDSKAPQVSQE